MPKQARKQRKNPAKSEACSMGAISYGAGKPIHANPYDAASQKRLWGWWRDGWLASLYIMTGMREPPADGQARQWQGRKAE
jgi:hypothetical protein